MVQGGQEARTRVEAPTDTHALPTAGAMRQSGASAGATVRRLAGRVLDVVLWVPAGLVLVLWALRVKDDPNDREDHA